MVAGLAGLWVAFRKTSATSATMPQTSQCACDAEPSRKGAKGWSADRSASYDFRQLLD
jgi:hypothetical protein